MIERDRNEEIKKETGEKGDAIPLIEVLMDNEVSIKGNVISQKEKENINEIIEQIYDMNWKQEDARIKMMFDLSLIIDALKNQIS
ncbi:hypothetical protein [Garciella nitratireducens]|uniref:hypothetical protein n=1 Tax=Garciella nitratireducens TaxID=218205 RepID=UPI001BD34177|nr:hypothetical protein [Garciella nitratireducens]